MFLNCFNDYAICIREKFARIQKLLGFVAILCLLSSLAYLMFYIGATASEYVLDAGKVFFEPLAKFLNFQNTSVEIYRNTSIILFCSIFPTIFAQYLLNKTEETMIFANNIKEDKIQQKEELERHQNYMARYDVIQRYSICLSIDWEGKKEVSNKNKELLNKSIFVKLEETLKKIEPLASVKAGFVFIFSSSNFSKYDLVYETILSQLSKTKHLIEAKYGYKLLPSMTTDASSLKQNYTTIQNEHFEIQSFNFKNRALVSAVFSDKYKHLKHKKYAGIPIGEYAYFGNEKTKTFELNVVHKDLSKILGSLS